MDGYHWRAPDHILGGTTVVVMSAENSDYDYNYKTDFEIWRENKEFERQNISRSQPPLDSDPIDMNTTNEKMSHLDLTPVDKKLHTPSH